MELQENSDEEMEYDSEIIDDTYDSIKCECLSETKLPGYILNLDSTINNEPNVVLTSSSKLSIFGVLSNDQFTKIAEYQHKKTLTGCKFSKSDCNIFYVGSEDGSTYLFDARIPTKPSLCFQDDTVDNKAYKSFNCFDVSSNDRLLAAGTDLFGGDAFILFWDVRKANILGGYWESHTDDITQVNFQPDNMNRLLSGSTDGLVNLYDLSKSCEDDALMDTFNTESSVDQLSWYNFNGKFNFSCVTFESDLLLWDCDMGSPYKKITRKNIAQVIQKEDEDVYIASSHYSMNGILLLAGLNVSNNHTLYGFKVEQKLELFTTLNSNKQRVRDSCYNENNNILISGGEKGLLNVWRLPLVT